jgi:ketosteroid isomerase-like protein
MSGDNVEVVRRSIEAWNRQDRHGLRGFYRADAEVDWSRSRSPFKGVYCGRREIEKFWDVFWSAWQEVRLETHDFTEAGSEVVVWNTAHMRGREGIEVSARTALVFTIETGQITCLRLFDEHDEALEAVGLTG